MNVTTISSNPSSNSGGTSDFERRFTTRPGGFGSRGGKGGGGGGGGGGDRQLEPLGKMFDRTPPVSPEAEKCLLGAMILDGRIIADVLSIIKGPEAFHSSAHALIYQAIVSISDKHNDIDPVLLEQRLADRGVLEEVGGRAYLGELVSAPPGTANAVHWAKIVSDKARLRRLIDAAGEILFQTYHHGQAEGDEAKQLVGWAEQKVFEIAREEHSADIESMQVMMQREIDLLNAIADGQLPAQGVKTGFADLDKMLGGLQPGEMIILAARPSMGKTALALNLAEQIATGKDLPRSTHLSRQPAPVGLFSLEMGKNALAQRWLSAWSGVESQRIRAGTLSKGMTRHGYVEELDEYKKLVDAAGALALAPLYVDDTPGLSITGLRARARRMVAQYGVQCIMIDYLQLLSSPTQARESRQVEVSAISRGVKELARELKIPVIALSQLNRGPEGREGNRPRMSDLRESGSLEQDADVVLLLHREEYYHKGEPAWDINSPQFDENNRDKVGQAEIIIAKQRNGPTGVVALSWDAGTTRFKNFAPTHAGDDAYGGFGHGGGGGSGGGGGHAGGGHAAHAPTGGHGGGGASGVGGGGMAYGGDFDAVGFGPIGPGPQQAPARSAGWHPGKQAGIPDNHRDGGGPDRSAPPPSGGDGGDGADEQAPF